MNDKPWCRVLAAVAALSMTFAMPSARSAPVGRPMREPAMAVCIREASGGRGWLEKTLWALRDQEGGWLGADITNADGTHDLGPLQVNSWWVARLAKISGRPSASIRWWLIHDACFNVRVARWIFLSGLALTHDYWKAIGVYHSPKSWRQRPYALSVAAHLRRRFGPRAFAATLSHSIR